MEHVNPLFALFKVKLDVHQFTPDEVSVKTRDNNLVIEAKHEERQDAHGFISRQFTRRYVLPDDVSIENISVNMSTDGILAIEAPRKTAMTAGEKVLPIRQTGRPAVVPPAPTTPTPTTPTSPSASAQERRQQESQSRGQTIPIERDGGQQPTTSP